VLVLCRLCRFSSQQTGIDYCDFFNNCVFSLVHVVQVFVAAETCCILLTVTFYRNVLTVNVILLDLIVLITVILLCIFVLYFFVRWWLRFVNCKVICRLSSRYTFIH